MSYVQEVNAIQRWFKRAANLNSYRLRNAPSRVARPTALFEAPGRKNDRYINRYVYVNRIDQYGKLFVTSLDELLDLQEKLSTDLMNNEMIVPIFANDTASADQVGLLKRVSIEFRNSDALDVSFIVHYEATYTKPQPDPAAAATSVTTHVSINEV